MITAVLVLALVVLAFLAWLVRRALGCRIGAATAVLDTHDIVCVEAGRRPRWVIQPRDASDERPVTDENGEPSVATWGHSVATLKEEAA